MTREEIAVYVASSLATGLGIVAVVGRSPKHLPVAVLLAFGLGVDAAQRLVRPLYVDASRPFAGEARALFHLGQAAFAAYPWAVLAAVLVVLGARSAWPVAALWAAYEALLVLGYRALDLREARLGTVYLAAQVLLVAGMGAVVVPWWRSWRRSKRALSAAEILVALAAGVEAALLVGPFLLREPWARARWTTMARPAYLLFYVVAIVVQGGALWVKRYRSIG